MTNTKDFRAGIRHAASIARDLANKQRAGSVIGANPRAHALRELATILEREAQR